MSELKTGYRQLSGGGMATPLREFIGRLKAFTPEVRSGDRGDLTIVKLDFTEVEVIETTEPYLYPVAQIEIPYSEWRNTSWAALLKSISDNLGPETTLDDLVGKKLRCYVELDRFMFHSDRTDTDVKRDCLLVVGLAEATATVASAEAIALAILNGKTLSEFNGVIFDTPEIRADKGVMAAIIAGNWVSEMVEQGKASVNADGIYQV